MLKYSTVQAWVSYEDSEQLDPTSTICAEMASEVTVHLLSTIYILTIHLMHGSRDKVLHARNLGM